jgi:hypothetical protein
VSTHPRLKHPPFIASCLGARAIQNPFNFRPLGITIAVILGEKCSQSGFDIYIFHCFLLRKTGVCLAGLW